MITQEWIEMNYGELLGVIQKLYNLHTGRDLDQLSSKPSIG